MQCHYTLFHALEIEVPNLGLNNRSINCSFSLPSALQWLPLLPLPSSFYPCVRYHFLWIIFLNDITFTTPIIHGRMPHSLLQPFCPNCDSHFLNKMSQVALLLFQHYPVKCHFIFISSSQRQSCAEHGSTTVTTSSAIWTIFFITMIIMCSTWFNRVPRPKGRSLSVSVDDSPSLSFSQSPSQLGWVHNNFDNN